MANTIGMAARNGAITIGTTIRTTIGIMGAPSVTTIGMEIMIAMTVAFWAGNTAAKLDGKSATFRRDR